MLVAETEHYLTLRVVSRVAPATPGRTYGPPEDCYPAEPAEVESLAIVAYGPDDCPIEIPAEVQQQLLGVFGNEIRQAALEYAADLAECSRG